MTDHEQQQLIAAACSARAQAHAPYSGFAVGAALLMQDGRIIEGCNVENASYGLTLCAERVAVVRAVAEGETAWRAIAVASPGGAAPCGACRQVLAEFCTDLPVLLVDTDAPDRIRHTTLATLLPDRFDASAIETSR